jgi:preprotein translocase subunit SecF
MLRLPIRKDATGADGIDHGVQAVRGRVARRSSQQSSDRQGRAGQGSCVNAAGAEVVTCSASSSSARRSATNWRQNGLNALIMVVVGVMIYLAVRFEWKFAVAAIIANLHDVVIILGFFAFFQWEFSLTVLAAVLAVLGYSVNESVVIFDRIRENFRKQRKMSVTEVIDHAITSTISRTIITHGCTQMMVLSMLFFGGQTLHYFAVALTIGICFGIYSSVFVAAALAMWLGVKREDLIKPIKEKDETDGAVFLFRVTAPRSGRSGARARSNSVRSPAGTRPASAGCVDSVRASGSSEAWGGTGAIISQRGAGLGSEAAKW